MKRIILLALCLLFIWNGCAYAAVALRMEDGALLLDEDGGVIVPLDACDDIVSLGESLFAAGISGRYALMDSAGSLLTGAKYTDLRLEGEFILACTDGFWGLLDKNGNEKSDFIYTRIVSGNSMCWAVKGEVNDLESDELFIINPDGKEQATGLYLRAMDDAAAQGLLAVQLPDSGLWGYCDAEGKLAIPDAFSHAGGFVSGAAPVAAEGRFGAISMQGKYIASPEYDFVEVTPGGLVIACNAGGARILDVYGAEIARFEGNGLAAAAAGDGFVIADGESLRLYDSRADLLAELASDASVYEGLDGRFIFAEGAWGESCVYLDGTQQRYQNIYPLGIAGDTQLYACLQANAARYVNDLLGEIQLSVDMESARYGVINGSGEILLGCEYESIDYLGDDRLQVYIDGQWQMIDSSGHIYWTHGIRQTEAPIS